MAGGDCRNPRRSRTSKSASISGRRLHPTLRWPACSACWCVAIYPAGSISEPLDRPRFSWGEGPANTAHVLPRSRNAAASDDALAGVEKDQPVAVDATYYVGAHGSSSAWRIMIKIMDRQNRLSGTRLDLPEKERRVRIEVTLDRSELRRLGLDTLTSLKAFRFQTLQGGYFQFRLPTFEDVSSLPAGPQAAIASRWEKQRRQKFQNTGVVGLKAMDEASEVQRTARRTEMRKSLSPGTKLRPVRRVGKGPSSTLVAYKDLTDRVLMALRHLGQRVRKSETGDV